MSEIRIKQTRNWEQKASREELVKVQTQQWISEMRDRYQRRLWGDDSHQNTCSGPCLRVTCKGLRCIAITKGAMEPLQFYKFLLPMKWFFKKKKASLLILLGFIWCTLIMFTFPSPNIPIPIAWKKTKQSQQASKQK